MSEYTSLEVSKRLADAGFNETSDDRYNDAGTIPTDAYRADTLLAWLLTKGWRCDEQYRDSKCYVLADLYGDYSPIHRHEEASAPTLPDALAEVVMKVIKVAK